jgi:hypothetical protein
MKLLGKIAKGRRADSTSIADAMAATCTIAPVARVSLAKPASTHGKVIREEDIGPEV